MGGENRVALVDKRAVVDLERGLGADAAPRGARASPASGVSSPQDRSNSSSSSSSDDSGYAGQGNRRALRRSVTGPLEGSADRRGEPWAAGRLWAARGGSGGSGGGDSAKRARERFLQRARELDTIAQNIQGSGLDGSVLKRVASEKLVAKPVPWSLRLLRLIESFSYFVFVCLLVAAEYIAALALMAVQVQKTFGETLDSASSAFHAEVAMDFGLAVWFFLEWVLRVALYGPRYTWYHLLPGSGFRIADLVLVLIIFATATTSFALRRVVAAQLDRGAASSASLILALCAEKLFILRLLTISNFLTYRTVRSRAHRTLADLRRTLESERSYWQIDERDVQLGERIGAGAFGAVYLGLWRGTLVAVKRGNVHVCDESSLNEFRKEAETLSHMRHPNVLLFLGMYLESATGSIAIVTEYCQRGDLRTLVHNPAVPLDARFRLRAAIGAACGLTYLHGQGVVHRDFKTSNLLVSGTEGASSAMVKVCDFGMARAMVHNRTLHGDFGKGESEVEAPESGQRGLGTVQYAAPEVLRSERCSTASDVYSYGVVLWELASRCTPYSGMPRYQVMIGVVDGNLRPDLSRLGEVEPDYVDLMLRCWHQDPSRRPDMATVLRELLLLIKCLGLATENELRRIVSL
ncbi:hypothetical protein CDCA_CDCA10G3062 [Cyanidium caldarium]|uniref:Protein kinase domain-containing protein n=1 Tax=Cyanidium caldarium TaxID=2771 RepID=A0AAV9IXM9_CYACA|nr:hypothetical protein CDCA_CDCA10G3062 [Cyanidium caldarium]